MQGALSGGRSPRHHSSEVASRCCSPRRQPPRRKIKSRVAATAEIFKCAIPRQRCLPACPAFRKYLRFMPQLDFPRKIMFVRITAGFMTQSALGPAHRYFPEALLVCIAFRKSVHRTILALKRAYIVFLTYLRNSSISLR